MRSTPLSIPMLFAATAVIGCSGSDEGHSTSADPRTSPPVVIVPDIPPTPYQHRKKIVKTRWDYSESTDSMTGKTTFVAKTRSTNYLLFDAPYEGTTYANLYLRSHPRKGRDVIFKIDRGQIICRTEQCSALLRFDDEKPIRLTASKPSDYDPTVLFITPYDRIASALMKASTMQIELTYYQEGSHVFSFDVEGFSPPKNLLPR